MHPIEHLRYVARSSGVAQETLVRETAGALLSFGHDPVELVTACRRMIARQPSSGPLVWLAARVLTAADPRAEARACLDAISEDTTARMLSRVLHTDSTVCVLGWPDLIGKALRRRGDVAVLVVDAIGEGTGLAQRLNEQEADVADVPESGLGAAVATSDLVLLESAAVGPTAFIAVSGSRAAAATAHSAGVPVWLVAGVGSRLPAAMWDPLVERSLGMIDPWDADEEVVPAELVGQLVSCDGPEEVPEALTYSDCPVAAELFRSAV